jgi:hypothetical protein
MLQLSPQPVTGTLNALDAVSPPFMPITASSPMPRFNFAFWSDPNAPFSGSIDLERSLDGGENWLFFRSDAALIGNDRVTAYQHSGTLEESEAGAQYRFRVVAYNFGNLYYRMSK